MTIYNANNLNPECYVKQGLSVKTSNLCSEIFLHTNEHSLTLPEELKQELWELYQKESIVNVRKAWENSVVKTYRAGADQELEGCLDQLRSWGFQGLENLRNTRRPKPPSLAEQGLETLKRISKDCYPCIYQDDADWDTIRAALERLKQLEQESHG